MSVEIVAIGGYGEVGKNMTAVRVDDEVVLLDMGLHLPNYIALTEEEAGENEAPLSFHCEGKHHLRKGRADAN